MLSPFSSEGPRFKLLTAFEFKLLATAGLVIWFAKWQDSVLADTPVPLERKTYRADLFGEAIPSRASAYLLDNQGEKIFIADSSETVSTESMAYTRPISEAERHFLARFYHQQKLRQTNVRPEQWAALMKNATVTFLAVQEIFQAASEQPEMNVPAQTILGNSQRAEQIFSALERRFGISKKVLQRFAETGDRSLAEWAFFVEQRQG